MKWNIGNKIGGLVVFAILSFAILGTWSYLTLNNFANSVEWSKHTLDVMRTNDLITSYIKDAETGQRGYIITGDKKYLEPYQSSKQLVYETLDKLKELSKTVAVQQQRLITYKTLLDEKYDEMQETIDARTNLGFEAAQKVVLTDKGKTIMDKFRKLSDDFNNEELVLMAARDKQMYSNATTTNYVIVLGSFIAALLLGIVSYYMIRNITTPLDKLTIIAAEIAKGDLSIEINDKVRNDEIGLLNNAFSIMVKNLRNSVEEITDGINLLGSSSTEILAATTQVSAGISETSSAISETTTTVEEVRQASQLSNEKASRVAENAQQNASANKAGKESIEKTIELVNQVKKQMEAIAGTVVRLSEQSQQIGGIIAAVNDVADQSNLLAVNASIEAAKAGEHGKGFAVVADEIKNLARLSKQSTAQVRNILIDVQKATTAAVMATEQGSKAVNNVVEQSAQAGESIKILSRSVNESVQAASQIVASSQQQNIGMDQVGLAINNINQAGAENAASMKQAEQAAKDLAELGNKLKQLVNQYKL